MSAVLTDTFLGDIPIERIDYLTVVRKLKTTIHTHERTTVVSRAATVVDCSGLTGVYRLYGSTKLVKRDGVWCSVERPVGCLAITVVVSE
jgi:hypothetical protein